jgi:hypothetical protein
MSITLLISTFLACRAEGACSRPRWFELKRRAK